MWPLGSRGGGVGVRYKNNFFPALLSRSITLFFFLFTLAFTDIRSGLLLVHFRHLASRNKISHIHIQEWFVGVNSPPRIWKKGENRKKRCGNRPNFRHPYILVGDKKMWPPKSVFSSTPARLPDTTLFIQLVHDQDRKVSEKYIYIN